MARDMRGLFPKSLTIDDVPAAVVERFRERFGIGALLKHPSEVAIELMAIDASASMDNPSKGNRTLADEVLQHVAALKDARHAGRIDDAVHQALLAMQRWAQLRANISFEAAVREKQRRRDRASALSDQDILAAVATHETKQAAAEALGISDRQLRNRLKALSGRKS